MNTQLDGIMGANPFVKGVLCSDANGLCISGGTHYYTMATLASNNLTWHPIISAKGALSANSAGTFTAIARLANSLNDDSSTKAPSVLIETASGSILVKDYDTMTMTIKCASADR